MNFFLNRYRLGAVFVLLVIAVGIKFYHYNYILNTPGQARNLRLPGLDEIVCKNLPRAPNLASPDHCGPRSIYGDGDWGITAYLTIYGVTNPEEAKEIVAFMIDARHKNGQDHIPVNVKFYAWPRSQANEFSNIKIFEKDF